MGAPILLEDPGSLDGVSNAIKYIEANAKGINKLIFVGDDSIYSYRDRQLLERALILGQQKKD